MLSLIGIDLDPGFPTTLKAHIKRKSYLIHHA